MEGAIADLREAAKLAPEQPAIHANLGEALGLQGRVDLARDAYDRAIQLAGGQAAGLRYRRSLLLPVIAESNEQIRAERSRLSAELAFMAKGKTRLKDPCVEVGHRGFLLAYHGRNNRDIQKQIASTFLAASPFLADALTKRKAKRRGRQRLGIFSANFKDHTVGRVNVGVFRHLPRDLFEVIAIRPDEPGDAFTQAIDAAADSTLRLLPDLMASRRAIAQLDLDVLLYADIGMEPFSYFLSFARLAPVQGVLWGHPDTTGVPNVDYYLSCRTNEPIGAQDAYSEKLVTLPRNYVCLDAPTEPVAPMNRSELGITNETVYLCPQMLFKVHPDFDAEIDALLKADPNGVLLFPAAPEKVWTELLTQRLKQTCPETFDRVRFFPMVPVEKFPSLLAAADAVVDTAHFTGGYTSYLAMSAGAPVVTWNGKFMRGRMTLGLYRQMGIEGLVASDSDDFVRIATRLAHDREFKRAKSDELRDQSSLIFEDRESIEDLGRTLYELPALHRR